MNCSSDLKHFSNSRPSASNFKSFSRSLEQFFLTVGQNNFGNKIPYFSIPWFRADVDLTKGFFLWKSAIYQQLPHQMGAYPIWCGSCLKNLKCYLIYILTSYLYLIGWPWWADGHGRGLAILHLRAWQLRGENFVRRGKSHGLAETKKNFGFRKKKSAPIPILSADTFDRYRISVRH